jgi:cation diffusion facilitator family transporter
LPRVATPRFAISLAILAAFLTIGLKFWAYWVTDSMGLLSDALESGINLMTALTAAFCLWYAARPIDPTHTYGHEKIEYFSSGLEGMLILVAGIAIFITAIARLIYPVPIESLDRGTIYALIATMVNLITGMLLIRVGKRTNSLILQADGKHLLTDVLTTFGVLIGLGLVWLTKMEWLDPLMAIVVACGIFWTGFDLIRQSFNGLMDRAIPLHMQEPLRQAIRSQLQAGFHYHALRTRQAGAVIFADFHLLVPGAMPVSEAHQLIDEIESCVERALPGIRLTIHVEPVESMTSWTDNPLAPYEMD